MQSIATLINPLLNLLPSASFLGQRSQIVSAGKDASSSVLQSTVIVECVIHSGRSGGDNLPGWGVLNTQYFPESEKVMCRSIQNPT